MIEPLLSVVVPVYNVEQYLKRCVDSILSQSYTNLQIILVDDGSKDTSGQICNELSLSDNRIEVIHKSNGGLSSARNAGLELARGELISFIDSDDYIDIDMYAEMVNALVSANADIAVCGRYDEYPDASRLCFTAETQLIFNGEEAMKRVLTWNQMDISACDKIYKASLWDGIRFPEGRNNEDICTVPSVIRLSDKIIHVGKAKYHYFHRLSSITTTYNKKKIEDYFHSIQHIMSFTEKNYPRITDELTGYLRITYMALLTMANSIGYKGEETLTAFIYLKKHWRDGFTDKRADKRTRLACLMIGLRLYRPIVYLKRKFKKRG